MQSAKTIVILIFLIICSCTCRSCCKRFRPPIDPFSMWGNEVSLNISQIKKLRNIVKIKKLATKNNKMFVCTMKKTSVNYRMVPSLSPCPFPFAPFKILEKIFMRMFVFSPSQGSSFMITSQTTCMIKRR